MTIFRSALPDWLAYRAAATPARIALIAGGRRWSFADLDSDATILARALASLGVRAGDRVATLLHNGAAPALLTHSLLRVGATLVPLNVRLTGAELAWQLEDSAARLLIIEDRTRDLAARARGGRHDLSLATFDPSNASTLVAETQVELDESGFSPRLAHDADSVLAIIYTSGTTGRPKGAMLTVANFWWSAIGSALNIGTREDDRWLACLPLFHVGGLSIVTRSAICGFSVVVHEAFDPEAVNRAIDEEGITIVSVVSVMLERMLDERRGRAYPPSLRCVLLGGSAIPGKLLERCDALGVPAMQTYGLTETTSQVATLAPDDAVRKPGSAGRPLYPNQLRIVRADGNDATTDEPGEILVRGPVVMAGYAGQPDATASAIVDGWLRTGDIARRDADGYLYLLDRRDDLIITGGENVYPAEVEAALLSHPLVAEAGVIGLKDEEWGQRVVAIVGMAGQDQTPVNAVELLQAHCRSLLAPYKIPSEIRIASESLPRTASGKLRRAELRERIASGTD